MKTKEIYNNSLEHIFDELLLVNLLLHKEVIKFREKHGEKQTSLQGLYITDEEVDNILQEGVISQAWVKEIKSFGKEHDKFVEAIRKMGSLIQDKIDISLEEGINLNLEKLRTLYNLSPREVDILCICLAPQVDVNYRVLFAYLQNDNTRKNPGVDFIVNLITNTFDEKIKTREYFSPQAPLFKYNILEFLEENYDTNRPLIARELKVNNRITDFLLNSNYFDDELSSVSELYNPQFGLKEVVIPENIKENLTNFINYYNNKATVENFIFSFQTVYGSQEIEVASAICHEIGVPLFEIDLMALVNSDVPFERGIILALRESNLRKTALFFKNTDILFSEVQDESYARRYFIKILDEQSWLTFVSSPKSLDIHGEFFKQKIIDIKLPIPEYASRKELWSKYLQHHEVAENVDIKEIAGKFNLSDGQIKEAVATAGTKALWRSPGNMQITQEDLYEACHLHSNQRLNDLAHKIKPRYNWEDLILPMDIIIMLQELTNMVTYRHVVFEEWGFGKKLSYGKGLSALFYGPPGTGKTMSADIIGHKLGMDLYKIDISTVVSKYIGETEKNLSRIFDEAKSSNAILFFDEADAIFGKRTEVKDSHDRYSNIEVSYLLQRIEEFNGIVILATNYSKNIDEAFLRRLNFSIGFPFPDEKSRLRIWKKIFPSDTPMEDEIDYKFLADKFEISGGNIKNIAISAAFFAAESDQKVAMGHLIKACEREFYKIGHLWDPKNFEYKNRDD